MGQYYLITNLDKKQYLHPHDFNEGMKLMEFGWGQGRSLLALNILLADGNGRGGGDLHIEPSQDKRNLVGSWAGDRIVIAGDYANPGNFLTEDQIEEIRIKLEESGSYKECPEYIKQNLNVFTACETLKFENISFEVIKILISANELDISYLQELKEWYISIKRDKKQIDFLSRVIKRKEEKNKAKKAKVL